jgi:hypothetical protein
MDSAPQQATGSRRLRVSVSGGSWALVLLVIPGLGSASAIAGGHHHDRVYVAAPAQVTSESRVIERVYTVAPEPMSRRRYLLVTPVADVAEATESDRQLSGSRDLSAASTPLLRTVTDPVTGELRPAPVEGLVGTRSPGVSRGLAPARTYREVVVPAPTRVIYRSTPAPSVLPVSPEPVRAVAPVSGPVRTTVVQETITVHEHTRYLAEPLVPKKKHCHWFH